MRLPLALAMTGALAWTVTLAVANLRSWYAYGRDLPLRTDFALYYVFARIGLTHGWSRLYDLAAQADVYRSLGHIWWFPLPYTPPMAWITAPFTALPLQTAYWVWAGLMALAFLIAWWLAAPAGWLARALCLSAALAPYPTLLGMELGQFIPVQLLAVAACCRLLERDRPVAAGLALGPIAVHPQAFWLVPVGLLVAGRWKTVCAWAVVAGMLGAASVATLGIHGTQAYFGRIALANSHPVEFFVARSIDLPAVIAAHHLPPLVQLLAQAAIAGLVVAAAWRHGRVEPHLALAAGLIGSVLVTSFIHLDDLMVLLPAAWLSLRRTRHPALVAVILAALVVALRLGYGAGTRVGEIMLLVELTWLATIALIPVRVPDEVAEGARRGASPPPRLRHGNRGRRTGHPQVLT
jgi:hypothetical protein